MDISELSAEEMISRFMAPIRKEHRVKRKPKTEDGNQGAEQGKVEGTAEQPKTEEGAKGERVVEGETVVKAETDKPKVEDGGKGETVVKEETVGKAEAESQVKAQENVRSEPAGDEEAKVEGEANASIEGGDGGEEAAGSKRKGEESGDKSKRQKLGKGQNKNRGDQRSSLATQLMNKAPHLCKNLHTSSSCPFGDGCKFSHDVKAFLEGSKALAEIPSLECPAVAAGRRCPYGVACRIPSCRDTWGEALLKGEVPAADSKEEPPREESNQLSRELQSALREVRGQKPYKWMQWKQKQDEFREIVKNNKSDPQIVDGSGAYEFGAKLRPEEKKRLDFQGKTYMAPLTTVGNLPFRRLCKTLGCDITVGEMALSHKIGEGQGSEWALFRRHKSEDFFGIQIAGSYSDQVSKCGELFERECSADFFDLNCGCPLDGVCSKGMGAELLDRTKRLREIVSVASASTSVPMTVKLRVGRHEDQERRMAHTLIEPLKAWGAAAVTLHGRSRVQRYSRLANWDYIGECAQIGARINLPVIGNGDVLSWEDYHAHMESSPLSTCMIARGALIKPWIFTEIKEKRYWDIRSSERLELMRNFCRFGLDHWGSDTLGVERTRSFLLEWQAWTCRYVPVGLLEVLPPRMNHRNPGFIARDDLEQLMSGTQASDWIKISEMLLGKVPEGFNFKPKHRSSEKSTSEATQAEG